MRTDRTPLMGMFVQYVRRLTFKPLVFLAVLSTAVILACKDDPTGLGGTGSLVLIVVPYEEAQPAAEAASKGETAATDVDERSPSVAPAAAEGQSPDPAVTKAANAGSAAEAAQQQSQRDFVRIVLVGPTSLTQDVAPNPDGSVDVTITDLLVGSYEIQLFGIDQDPNGDFVSEFGRTTGVQVLEDQTRQATISFGSFVPDIDPTIQTTTSAFRFEIGYRRVPTATRYFAEVDTDPNFSAPSTFSLADTSVVLSVTDLGTYYFRVRAENSIVSASQAKPSDPVAFDVVADLGGPTGDDAGSAMFLGTVNTATGQYPDFNIYPGTDEDWFALDLTTDATLSVEVLSVSLTQPALEMASPEGTASPSDLDPVLEIFDPGLNLVASNDDDVTEEPRITDLPISTDGTHYIRVTSWNQESVGHYELIVTVNAEPVATVTVDPPTATISPSGAVQLTGRTFDISGGELFGREAIWSHGDANVATVAPDGLVTGVADGTATITFSSETITASATITVLSVTVAKVVITPTSATLRGIGQSANFTAEARDATDAPITGRIFNWYTSNTDVADASAGRVEGFGNGQTVVVAETDGVEGYALVTVTDPSAAAANYWSSGPASGVPENLFDIWGTSSTAIYAVGAAGRILYNDGTGWTPQTSGTVDDLLRVWGVDEYTVWAVGGVGGVFSTGDMGVTWTRTALPTTELLQGIWGSAGNDIFVVGGLGGTGVALHYDGTTWSNMSIPTPLNRLASVWGSASDDVFAVGGGGVILHYDGTAWTQMTSPTSNFLRTVWGTSNDDIFAVGINGTIVHYDGLSWTDMTDPAATTMSLRSVWGTSSTEVIAVGDGGTIIQYDGISWSADVSGSTTTLWGVFGLPNPGVLAVGNNGTIRTGNRGATADITASPTNLRPDGISTSTITVQIKDAGGANITSGGGVVTLSTTAGTLSLVIDNGDGSYTVTLTSSLITETATITGTMNGQAIVDDATVDFVAADPAQTTITGSPTSIPADGASTSTITVQLNDASGNPLSFGGDAVVLLTNLGTLGAVTDNLDGTYTATLTAGTTTGTATVTGTLNAVSITNSTNVTFTSSSTVSGTVYYSTTTLDGISVDLVQGDVLDPPLATTTTASGGFYIFTGVADGTYWIKVNGGGEFIGWVASSVVVASGNMTLDMDLPKLMTLLTPANGATGQSLLPTLTWEANPQATKYDIQINLTTTFELIELKTNITTTNYTLQTTLTPGANYTWQLDAHDAVGHRVGTTDNAFTFTTSSAASQLAVTGITDPITEGASSDVTVTARDQFGNVATEYTGTVAFTSSDGSATLPANYTFAVADGGVHVFSGGVTFVTVGEQSVTATDVAVGTITGSQTAITVAGAAVTVVTAYVVNLRDSTVSVIETSTNTVVATVPVGDQPLDVAVTPDGAFAYVVNFGGGVSVIETSTNTVVTTVPMGLGRAVAIPAAGDFAYVARFLGSVSVIDISSNTVVQSIFIDGVLFDLAVTPDGAFVYVTDFDANAVSVIETASNTLVATIPVGIGPGGVAITPDGALAYVANLNDNHVSIIETASNTVIGSVPTRNPRDVAFSPDGALAYITTAGGGNPSVLVVETATNAILATISVGVFPNNSVDAIAVTPDGAFAYVNVGNSDGPDTTLVIDTSTNAVVATVVVGDGPSGVAIATITPSP